MNLTEIKALIDAMAASDLSEMEMKRDGMVLRLVRRKAPSSATAPADTTMSATVPRATHHSAASVVAPASSEITTPLYGVVHWRPSPGATPFVTPGQAIKAGQVVCVVEAMKVFHEVRTEVDATVLALLVESDAEVEAGQPLLRLG